MINDLDPITNNINKAVRDYERLKWGNKMKKTIEVNVWKTQSGLVRECVSDSLPDRELKMLSGNELLYTRTIEYGESRKDEVKKEVESWIDSALMFYSSIYSIVLPDGALEILKKYEGKRCRFTVEVLE